MLVTYDLCAVIFFIIISAFSFRAEIQTSILLMEYMSSTQVVGRDSHLVIVKVR